MQAKLNAATEAVLNGVKEVRIVKGSDPDIVTRVFAGEVIGTAVI
jgi:acetylglutamate kinase